MDFHALALLKCSTQTVITSSNFYFMRYLFLSFFVWVTCTFSNVIAQPQFSIQAVSTGFTRPVKVTHAFDDRLIIAEMGGKIRILKNGSVLSQPFLDISSKINDPNWAGIFSITFDPAYLNNGFFYVMYVIKNSTEIQVSRFTRSAGNPNLADANSEQKVLTIAYTDVLGGHRGGDMAFGKDNFLYISTGDNGPGSRGVIGDPENNAQDPTKLFGKLLRLDVSQDLPLDMADNKVFAVGLRNPWRFSIDRANGDFWIGDNGQDGWEEINYLKYPFEISAPNFGWNCLEGNQSYTTSHCTPGTSYQAPKAVYPGYTNNGHQDASVMGGYVYRGSQYRSLQGYYFFGDYATGKVGFIGSGGTVNWEAGLTYPSLISFGEDVSGELYVLSITEGTLGKLTSTADPLPVQLVSFRLHHQEGASVLEWETAEERDFDFFEVQRSTDGKRFEALQQIQGVETGHSYLFLDPMPSAETCYYRLKMVDVDQTYAYSKILVSKPSKTNDLFVYPNPMAGQSMINGVYEGDKLTLFGANGVLIRQFVWNNSLGRNFDLHDLGTGLYLLTIENPKTGTSRQLRIIKR
jgi:glucose/arabinose dehydrogenase